MYSVNTIHRPNVGSMLSHCLRRWPNIQPTFSQCIVFTGRPMASDHFGKIEQNKMRHTSCVINPYPEFDIPMLVDTICDKRKKLLNKIIDFFKGGGKFHPLAPQSLDPPLTS